MQKFVRRLIETEEMPIGQISAHSRKDQNVRLGCEPIVKIKHYCIDAETLLT